MANNRNIDLTGCKIGLLTVVGRDGVTNDAHVAWLCACECGKNKRIASNSLLRKNPVKSCGCLNAVVAQVKRKEPSWNAGKTYSIRQGGHVYATRHAWAKAAIRKFGNACQLCGWADARCDVHHKTFRADNGGNSLDNAIVVCPNCHRVLHEGKR